MQTFKPEDILKNNVSDHKKPQQPVDNTTARKLALFGLSFICILALMFSFINASKAKALPQKSQNADIGKVMQKVYGIALNIDGENKVYLKNSTDAKAVLKEIEKTYAPSDNMDIKKGYFKEKIAFTGSWINKSQVSDVKTAVDTMLYGNVDVLQYEAQPGDNLWSIARKKDMHVKDILAANPGLDEEKLAIGQVINLKKPKPQVTFVAVFKGERKKTIPYETKVERDSSLDRGKEKVVTEGKNGTRIFTYELTTVNGNVTDKKILADRITEKPVDKVVKAGSARRATRLLASRSGESQGSGDLIWPLRGPITSGFGYRGGEYHTGIDIDGETGDAVSAADSGTVVFAGWNGSYGKSILIDHGGGVITRYAHLSSYSVNEGERVGRGEYIGAVGSTGRSTGSHLHFEVIVNGSVRSPLRYLN